MQPSQSFISTELNEDQYQDLITFNRDSFSVLQGSELGIFNQNINYSTLSNPVNSSFINLNDDDKQDIILFNETENSFSIWLANPDGTFSERTDYLTLSNPLNSYLTDLNQDNQQDILLFNQDDTFSVWLANTDGTFTDRQDFNTKSNNDNQFLLDLNGDSREDLVSFNQDPSFSIWLAQDSDRYRAKIDYSLPSNLSTFFSEDLNGDQKIDLVTINEDATFSIWLNDGNGGFNNSNNYSLNNNPLASFLDDINGDETKDLVFFDDDSILAVWLGKDDGTFGFLKDYQALSQTVNTIFQDLNGDDNEDYLLVQNDNQFSVWLNENDNYIEQPEYKSQENIEDGFLSDFDQDGKKDLVLGNQDNSFSVWSGTSEGTFAEREDIFLDPEDDYWEYLTDVNNDGIEDLVSSNESQFSFDEADEDDTDFIPSYSTTLSVALGDGDGDFAEAVDYQVDSYVSSIATGDIDSDGNEDIILSSEQEITLEEGDGYGGTYTYTVAQPTIKVLLGEGDSTFAQPIYYLVNDDFDSIDSQDQGIAFDPDYFDQLIVEDLDQDNHLDVIGIDTDHGTIKVFLNDGSGGLTNTSGYEPLEFIGVTKDTDFNSDGILDLVVTGSKDDLAIASVLLGVGDGTFNQTEEYELTSNPDSLYWSDLNSDNIPDLVELNSESETVIPSSTLISTGDGAFTVNEDFSVFESPANNYFADLDGDQIPEIVSVRDDNNFSIWQSDSDNTLSPRAKYTSLSNWSDTRLSDLNGDDLSDSVLVNDDDTFSTWLKQSDLSYGERTDHLLPQDVIETYSGDLNGDGLEDTVTLGGENLFVRLNDDVEGTLSPIQSYSTLTSAYAGSLEDFNNDGNLDFISFHDRSYSIWLGVEDGKLGSRSDFSKPRKGYYQSDLIGDLNNDGYLDLLLSNDKSDYSIRLNNGDGTFTPGENVSFGNSIIAMALADVNQDGLVDLISTVYGGNNDEKLKVSFGQGDGTFSESTENDLNYSYDILLPEDIDNDGDLDLIATDNGFIARLSIFNNQGDGTFVIGADKEIQQYIADVRYEDVNQDGIKDIVTASRYEFSILLGKVDGTLEDPDSYRILGLADLALVEDDSNDVALYIADEDGSLTEPTDITLVENLTSQSEILTTQVDNVTTQIKKDINEDNIEDLVSLNSENDLVAVELGQADGKAAEAIQYAVGDNPSAIAAADLDLDGALDFVTTNSNSNNISVLWGKGDGSFEESVEYQVGRKPVDLNLEDYDLDGYLDILVLNQDDDNLTLLTGSSYGTFKDVKELDANQIVSPTINNRHFENIELEDLNHDGYLDIVGTVYFSSGWYNSDRSFAVLLGNRDGSFSNAQFYSSGGNASSFELGDLDGDGFLDIIATNNNYYGGISVSLGRQDGAFSDFASYSLGDYSYPQSVTLEDTNNDGFLDIIATNRGQEGTTSKVSILLGKGDGSFEDKIDFAVDYNPIAVKLEDVNTDGILDLFTANQGKRNDNGKYDSTVSVLLGKSDGSFVDKIDFAVGENPQDLELKDLNSDDLLDIVTINYGERKRYGGYNNNVSILLGNSDGSFVESTNLAVGSGDPHNLELQDVNDDNILDIFVSKNGSISLSLGLEDGTFQEPLTFSTSSSNGAFALEDLDGDLDVDLVYPQNNRTYFSFGSSVNSQIIVNSNNLYGGFSNFEGDRTFEYDPTFNQLTRSTDELGRVTINDLDPSNGNVLSRTQVVGRIGGEDDVVTSYTYTEAGLIDTMTDAEGRVTDYDYDGYGRLIKETAAKGTPQETVRQYEYDASGNQTAIRDENGDRTEFEYDQLNRIIKITEADPDGESGELTSPVTSYSYDPAGNLLETVDANQNVTKNEYDSDDRLTKTIDAEGGETNLKYDKNGNLIELRDAEGRTAKSVYDSRSRLTEIIDPLNNSTKYEYDDDDNLITTIDPLGNKTRNFYDARDRLIRTLDAENNPTNYLYDAGDNLVEVRDGNNHPTRFRYDDLNRQVEQVNALGDSFTTEYDQVGNVISTLDEEGRIFEYVYDPLDRLTSSIDAEEGVVEFEYDPVGNITSITDEEKQTTKFQYDALNRQTTVTDPLSNPTSFTYDPVGNLKTVTDANLNPTKYDYDKLNRVTIVTNAVGDTVETEYDQVGNVVKVTDELQRTTSFTYDERDLLTSVTDPELNTTTTEYDKVGNVIAVTDGRKNQTKYEYDKIYRLTKEIDANNQDVNYQYDPVGNLNRFTDELDRPTTFEYDQLNRQIKAIDPLQHPTTWTYDKVGNLISQTDANNHTTRYTYDNLNRPTVITNHLQDTVKTEYDGVGNITAITDELNRTTRYTYDKLNRQTSITDPNTHKSTTEYDPVGNILSITDPNTNQTKYDYDQLNRLISVTDGENHPTTYNYDPVGNLISLTDPEENTTKYTYDDLNRLLTDTNQLSKTRTYQYDEVGNRISSIDRNGREINYAFDKLNRLTTEIWLDDNNNPIHTINSNYDAASQLLDISDPNSAYSYDYDLDGRVISVDNAGTPNVPNVVFDYNYDPVDNLTTVKDSIEGEAKGVESFTYDELDRVTKITQSGEGVSDKRVDYNYDAASQVKEITRFSNLAGSQEIAQSSYNYDKAGRLTDLTHDQEGNVLSAYEWAYDKANRITQAVSPEGVSNYDYDKTDQLVDAEYDYQERESYLYDKNGNRTNDGYVTGENNQLLSDGTFNYEYDAEGNRVRRVEIETGEVTEYQWDYRNRLVEVETKDREGNITSYAEYTYDVFERRIAKSVDSDGDGVGEAVEERFIYDGDHIALTFDGDGNLTERFLHGLQIDEVLAQENAGGEVLWALADHQGSVKMLLDNQGNLVNEISYDAFGNITVEINPEINFRFSYTGRELDPETGNYFYRTRYLDPNTGQFISQDTIGFAGGDSNLYRYVVNSPVNFIDPFGYYKHGGVQTLDRGLGGGRGMMPGTGRMYVPPRGGFRPPAGGGYRGTDVPNYNPSIPPIPPSGIPNQTVSPVFLPEQDLDPLEINPEENNNDFFNPDEPDSWFDKFKDKIEDLKEWYEDKQREKEKNKDNNQGDSCGIGDRPDYLDPQATNEPQPPEGSKDDNSQQDSGNENSDDPWDDVSDEDFDEFIETKSYRDPVADAIDHIMNDHTPEKRKERFEELGLQDKDVIGLQKILHETYGEPLETWTRLGESKDTKAYVNQDGKTIFIDNPINPTIFPPTISVEKYLTEDNFIKDPKD